MFKNKNRIMAISLAIGLVFSCNSFVFGEQDVPSGLPETVLQGGAGDSEPSERVADPETAIGGELDGETGEQKEVTTEETIEVPEEEVVEAVTGEIGVPSRMAARSIIPSPGASEFWVSATYDGNGSQVEDATHYRTLQAALTAAAPGTTINLTEGTYDVGEMTHYHLLIEKENITIRGADGTRKEDVIIKGDSRASFVIRPRASGIKLEGFTIDPADGRTLPNQYAIKCETPVSTVLDGNITIKDIIISSSYNNAIDINGVNNVKIDNVKIGTVEKGAGIQLSHCSGITITNCDLSDLGNSAWGGIGLNANTSYTKEISNISISDCIFSDDTSKPSVYYDLRDNSGQLAGTIKLGTISIDGELFVVPSNDAGSTGLLYSERDKALLSANALMGYMIDPETNSKIPTSGASLQALVDSAQPGDIITLEATDYDLSQTALGYLLIKTDDITIQGVEGTTIKGSEAESYIIRTKASGVTLDGFTITPTETTTASKGIQYAIKCETPEAEPTSETLNLDGGITISNIKITKSHHSAIDINGVDNVTIENVIVENVQKGTGIHLANCSDIKIEGCDLTNVSENAWGSIAFETSDLYSKKISDISISNCNFPIGSTKPSVYYNLTDTKLTEGKIELATISIDKLPYLVSDLTGKIGSFYATESEAIVAAKTSKTYVLDTGTGNTIVVPGGSVQAAIDAVKDGGTVKVLRGTYDEALKITKSVNLVAEDPSAHDSKIKAIFIEYDLDEVIINGFNIYGNDDSLSGDVNPAALYVSGNNENIKIINNKFSGSENYLSNSEPSTVSGKGYPMGIVTGTGITDLLIQGNTFNQLNAAVYTNDFSNNSTITIDNNLFDKLGRGIVAAPCGSLKITGNTFSKINEYTYDDGSTSTYAGACIRVADVTNITVTGNSFNVSTFGDNSYIIARTLKDNVVSESIDLSGNTIEGKPIAEANAAQWAKIKDSDTTAAIYPERYIVSLGDIVNNNTIPVYLEGLTATATLQTTFKFNITQNNTNIVYNVVAASGTDASGRKNHIADIKLSGSGQQYGTFTIALASTTKVENLDAADSRYHSFVDATAAAKTLTLPKGPAAPTANRVSGAYANGTLVSLAGTSGSIYYTVDGSRATSGSPAYGTPISINRAFTLRAVTAAAINGFTVYSNELVANYTLYTPSGGSDDSSGSDSSSSTPSTPSAPSTTSTTSTATVRNVVDSITNTVDLADNDTPLGVALGIADPRKVPYISGYGDGTIRPNGTLSRAELAQIIFNLFMGASDSSSADISYPDIPNDYWARKVIAYVTSKGYMTGYPEGIFAPGKNITRAEFATVLAKAKGLTETGNTTFGDIAGHWAEQSIRALAADGAVSGYEDGSFHPDQTITRAEAISIIHRLEKRPENFNKKKTFSDLPENSWAYPFMMSATNGSLETE